MVRRGRQRNKVAGDNAATCRHRWAIFIILLSMVNTALATPPTKPTSTSVSQPVSQRIEQPYQPGLLAEIYKLPVRPRSLRNPIPGLAVSVVRVASTPNISSATDVGGITESVQVEFSGELRFLSTGDYTFSAAADDAMDMQIDGKPVLANAWINGSNAPTAATARFTEGWHPIHVRFFQGDGGFNLKIRWQPPGASEIHEIPGEQFRVSSDRIAAAQKKTTTDEQGENVDPARAHRFVFRTTGFFELPESDGDLLVEMLEGPTLYSESARKDFAQLLKKFNFQSLPYWHQVMVLSGFLRGWHTEHTERGEINVRAPYVLSEPQATEYDGWHGSKRQGFKHIVTIQQQQFTIYTPAADSPEREDVAQAIAGLPATLRRLLKRVLVEPYGTANEFNGGGDQIWVRRGGPTPLSMLDDTLSHEIGHILMNHTDCYRPWQDAIAQDVLSVSHYGRMNPSEDFGEFVRLFLSTRGDEAQIASLRQLFPARNRVLDAALKQIDFDWKQG
jgi:hypothetical protein